MKIILVTNICRDLYYSKALIQDFVASGWEVTVFANPDDTVPLMEKICAYKPVHFFPRGTNVFSEWKLLRLLKALLKAEKPDCVLLFNAKPVIYGGLAARSLGIPALVNMTGLGRVYLKKSLLQSLLSFLYSRVLRARHTFTFFANPDDRALFLKKGIVLDSNSVVVPGTGVDIQYYKRTMPLEQADICEKITRFVYAGRLLVSKGLVEYLNASRQLKRIYGDRVSCAVLGKFEDTITDDADVISQSFVDEYIQDGSIVYEGFITDIKTYLETKADVVVLPSYYREGVPRILLQAMALECALIGADTPGTRVPIFDGKNGFLCRPKDTADLLQKMISYLNLTQDEKYTMRKTSRLLAETHFDEKRVIQLHKEKITELVNKKA